MATTANTSVSKKSTAATKKTATSSTATKKSPTAAKSTTARSKTSSGAVTTKKLNKSKPKIALFIDVDNVGINRENLLEILFYVNGKYNVELCKLYGFSEDSLPGIKEITEDYNLTTVGKMKFKIPGQNCLDSRLLIDAYACAQNNVHCLDMIFVWCYPCDLETLFEKIVALGIATATIDHHAFDCKNKYVSQTFKLFSTYNFDVDSAMYGQIQNATVTNAAALPDQPVTTTVTATAGNQQAVNDLQTVLETGNVPTLPRREIPERSVKPTPEAGNNAPATTTTETPAPEQENIRPHTGESIVDIISRKLNIQLPSEDDQPSTDTAPAPAEANDSNTVSILDVIKQVGILDDTKPENKKYEDTIGDL